MKHPVAAAAGNHDVVVMIDPGHARSVRAGSRPPERRASASWLVAVIVLAGSLGTAQLASAAPQAELWARWTAHDPAATTTIDHRRWSHFLAKYVVDSRAGIHRVRYGGVSGEAHAALAAYIHDLTVKLVLDYYPVDTIRDIDISPGLFSDGPWGRKLIEVEGAALSLNDIEHRILRPIWRDARIHYAVSCASIGCPNLQPTAFTGINADELMAAAARAYINHYRGVRIDGDRLIVSKIYTWFREDFGATDADVVAHLKEFAAPELRARLDGITRIDGYAYDWRLNDAAVVRVKVQGRR